MDSYAHLSDKLDNLAANLKEKGLDNFGLLKKEFPEKAKFEMCLTKLPYPYSYMNEFEKFNHPIPSIEEFHNDLTDEALPESEYNRLLKACQLFNIQNLGELHDLYLKVDVLLLASVFEAYRQMGLDVYKLDPSFYVSAPSFSFDAMLLMTEVKLELLSDSEQYSFFEKGMRGGVSSIYKRLATANSDKLSTFDKRTKPSTLFYTGEVIDSNSNCFNK
jgi:hypothetical protein